MFKIFAFLFLAFSTLSAEIAPKIDNIEAYVDLSIAELKEKVEAIVNIPPHERNFANTILAWEELGTAFFTKAACLKFVDKGEKGFQKMCAGFHSLIEKNEVKELFASFIDRGDFSPSEKYYLRPFKKVEGDLPFTESFGKAKKDCGDKLTVVNWNVCCLPGQMPLLFGGILPAEKRLDRIIFLLKKVDADVICLQEVFERKTALKLIEALKDDYHVFYYHMSPRNLGFNLQTVGLSSGLFVASKFPVNHPRFEKFAKVVQPYIERGFFSFEVQGIKLVTTHLEATLKGISDPEISRKEQIEQLLKCQPTIICGDLNIAWGKNEPAEVLLKDLYKDPYNEGRTTCTFANCTHCDYSDETPQILDYLLVSKTSPHKIKTEVLAVCGPKNALEAISDHHLQLSTIELK